MTVDCLILNMTHVDRIEPIEVSSVPSDGDCTIWSCFVIAEGDKLVG